MMMIEITAGDIHIYADHPENEIVCWVSDEWEEDPDIVPAICRAVALALTNPSALRILLRKEADHDRAATDYVSASDRICPWCTAMMEPHEDMTIEKGFGLQDAYCPSCKAFVTEAWRLVDLIDVYEGGRDE
jgi:hypothetical protein